MERARRLLVGSIVVAVWAVIWRGAAAFIGDNAIGEVCNVLAIVEFAAAGVGLTAGAVMYLLASNSSRG